MDEPVIELDAEQAALRRRDADWVRQCLAGDQRAFGQLYDAWFDRVFDLVDRIVRDRDVAAEVSQEAFFSAWRNLRGLENQDAFGGWLLRIARNGAYNRIQKEQRSYAVDDEGLAVIESVGASSAGAPSGFGVEDRLGRAATPGAAVEDAEIVSLVWQAAEALPERDVEVLDLQLRHGLSPAEIGEVMGMNRNAANQLVHRLKSRLETAIRARVLWRGGTPTCQILAQRFVDLGITRFGPEAVRVTERHLPSCVECDERQRLGLEPAALFAAVPMVAVPIAVKHAAAAALATSGVPMGGSVFAAAAGIAGQAAGHVGSVAGGAVNPGVGSTIGHAVSGTGVDPANLGSNVGNALQGHGAVGSNVGHAVSTHGVTPSLGADVGHAASTPGGIGSNVGSAVGGSPNVAPVGSGAGGGGGTPGAGLGQAAGQELGTPPGIESAAHHAGDVVSIDEAAKVAAGGAPPAPIPPPPAPPAPPSGGGTPRILVLAGAAAGILVLLFVFGLWWGGRGDDTDLIASGNPTAQGSKQTSTTAAGTTSTADGPGTTTDSSVVEETTVPGGDPSTTAPPTTKAGTPTTRATDPTTTPTTTSSPTTQPTTTTTQPTTTTTAPPKVSLSITNTPKNTNGWYMSAPTRVLATAPPPVLTWSVDPAAGFTVLVSGPGQRPSVDLPPGTFSSTMPSGSQNLCPGSVITSPFTAAVTQCGNLAVGDYTYTLTVKNAQGQVVATAPPVVLRVDAAPIN